MTKEQDKLKYNRFKLNQQLKQRAAVAIRELKEVYAHKDLQLNVGTMKHHPRVLFDHLEELLDAINEAA